MGNLATELNDLINPEVSHLSGELGIPLGGQKVVDVGGRPGYVWVRVRNTQNEVVQAHNQKVSPTYGLPVEIVFDGKKWEILGRDVDRYNNWGSTSSFLPAHGNSHSMMAGTGGGGDPVWVDSRQFLPMLAFPSGSIAGPNLVLYPYLLRKSDNSWAYIGNTGTANFTGPSGSFSRLYLIVQDTSVGNFYFLTGTPFSIGITGTSALLPFMPRLDNQNNLPIAFVRVPSGTSSIGWDNIIDARQFFTPSITGSSGGGGGITNHELLNGLLPTGSVIGDHYHLTSGQYYQITDENFVLATHLTGMNFTDSRELTTDQNIVEGFGHLQAQNSYGWITNTNNWSFTSADAPSYVVDIDGSITGTIGVGDKISLSHLGQTKFFIVTKIGPLGGSTYPYTLYGGTDYTLTTGAISSTMFSHMKSPVGFPNEIRKWSVIVTGTVNSSKASPTQDVWYGHTGMSPSGPSIVIPIGQWRVGWKVLQEWATTLAAVGVAGARTSLSTSPSSESSPIHTSQTVVTGPIGSNTDRATHREPPGLVILANSKTTYYLIALTGQAGMTSISFRGDIATTLISAECAYL